MQIYEPGRNFSRNFRGFGMPTPKSDRMVESSDSNPILNSKA